MADLIDRIDRIESAIRHIQTSTDIDPWAAEIAVEAMRKQIPQRPVIGYAFPGKLREVMKRTDPEKAETKTDCCPVCGRTLGVSKFVQTQSGLRFGDQHCKRCGQTIDWEDVRDDEHIADVSKKVERASDTAQNVRDEDLISKLSEIRSEYNCFDEDGEPQYRALSEAIRILSQLADGDTISRQAAIEAITAALMPSIPLSAVIRAKNRLKDLPTVQSDHIADIGKKVSISCGHENDVIFRQSALDAIMGQPPEPHYPSWYAAQIEKLPAAQPATNCSEIPNGSDDTISRQMALDALHVMPDIKEIEKIIIDHIYIGDQKLTDLVASGRLRLVGFCEECKHCFPPLVSMVDGEVAQVTSERCSICNGYVEKNGWCYKFERRTDEQTVSE